MMTAPVCVSAGEYPADRNSCATMSLTASASISVWVLSGVKYTLLLYRISLPVIAMRGAVKYPAVLSISMRLNTTWVVDVPISIPTLKICAIGIKKQQNLTILRSSRLCCLMRLTLL